MIRAGGLIMVSTMARLRMSNLSINGISRLRMLRRGLVIN